MATKGDPGAPFGSEHPKVLLVEGDDEFYLLLQLLEDPALAQCSIDVRIYGGTGELGRTLKALRHSAPRGFRQHVTTLAVWRDADQDPVGALREVRGALEAAGFSAPQHSGEFADGVPRVGVFILPDGVSQGALENLCLASAADARPMQCVDDYLTCLQRTGVRLHPNLGKTRTHAFLASREEPGLKIGEAAKAGYWDFSHPVWQPLIEFIKTM